MMTKDNFIGALSAFENGTLSNAEIAELIASSPRFLPTLTKSAADTSRERFGMHVRLRGLIEFTNFCRNDCYYCGIRASNVHAGRYRMSAEEILACCDAGYKLGFRTFVLQGGEDAYFTDERLCAIVSAIRDKYPDSAVTLSVGERSRESYQALYNAGARRYLLRHETASAEHYKCLHPSGMSFSNRIRCLWDLKEIGFETGAGFMVGSPYQNYDALAADMAFLRELQPQMVGIGAFIPHEHTPFRDSQPGTLGLTLAMIALTRLLLPCANIPATTAMAALAPDGRLRALDAGANAVMPNLSQREYRSLYTLYNGKTSTDEDAAATLEAVNRQLSAAGYILDTGIA